MDIEYLLFLQELRSATGGLFDGFFSQITSFGESPLVLVFLAVIYWCVSKAMGTYVLMGLSFNRLINGLIKCTACVYRPWIRDARVQPVESAIKKATGYSFPSGHTTNAISIFGGPALRKETSWPLKLGLFMIVLLVGLSRNWLGVHTPQDVVVAIVLGSLVMLFTGWLCDMLEEHPERDVWVLLIGTLCCIGLSVYVSVKQYPMDYDASGALVVDPAKMAIDSYKNAGWAFGFFAGWFVEKRWIGFTSDGTTCQRWSRAVWGIPLLLLVRYPLTDFVSAQFAGGLGGAIANALQMFFIVAVAPVLFKVAERQWQRDSAEPASDVVVQPAKASASGSGKHFRG